MFERLSTVSFESVGDASRLFLDYLASPSKGLPPFIAGVGSDASFWKERADAAAGTHRGDASAWRTVVEEVHSLSKRLGAGGPTLHKVEQLASGSACCVITGQQPGVLGGPLLAVYKVVTAVALAERIERDAGVPCVAIYWCGSDDTDFQEIRGFHLLTRDASPVSAALPQDSHSTGVPVGDIAAEWTMRLWQGVRGFAREFEPSRADSIEKAVERGTDHAEVTSSVLLDLLGGEFAIVDGRSPAVRAYAQPLFAAYVQQEEEVKRVVRDAGSRLETQGYHAQLVPGQDSGVFLMEDGRRKTVPPENHAALLAAVENDVARCAPGVALRNLVQDTTFNPVAAVLGPAEIAYRAQIGGLYERFAVRRPVDFPRMAATFVPAVLSELLCGAEDLVRDPAACARRVYRDSVPSSVREAAAEFERRVNDASRSLLEGVETGFEGVEAAINGRARGKIRSRLKEVEARAAQALDAVEDAGKKMALARWPFLSDLPQLIRPEQKFQERYYSGLVPFLFGGRGADPRSLVGLATGHVDELLDGRASHIVYSTHR